MAHLQLIKNLRLLRRSHGYTQQNIADHLKLSRQAYTNYEKGLRSPDIDTIISLSNLYQVTLDQLISPNIYASATKARETNSYHYRKIQTESNNTMYLSDGETDLLLKYRELNEEDKKVLEGFLSNKGAD